MEDLEKMILKDIKKLTNDQQVSLIKKLLSSEGWIDWLWLVAAGISERKEE